MANQSIECSLEFSNGKKVEKTVSLVGEGKEYLSNLSAALQSLSTEVNSIITEVVEEERATGAASKRALSEDGELFIPGKTLSIVVPCSDESEDEEDLPPEAKQLRT